MTNEKKITILLLGSRGFPFGSATIQRQVQLAKSLLNADFKVIVINNRGSHSYFISKREKILTHGYYQGIEYFYSSLISYKSRFYLIRNAFKLIGVFNEFFIILYYRLFNNSKHILYRSNKLKQSKYYYFISRLLRMELVYDYVEFYDSLGKRDTDNLDNLELSFDYNFYKYTDKLIVISDFLEKHIQNITSNTPRIKIPPIIDFSYFDKVSPLIDLKPYFLFCGSANYKDLIDFVIEVFIRSNAIRRNFKLKLIINGSLNQLNILDDYLKVRKCENHIELLSKLTYLDLVTHYKSATALLIPISSNIQDQARFPFKICEYTASKRPIITSDSGAIGEYFEDNINAFIAKTDNLDDFTGKLNFVMDHQLFADEIGESGYKLGKNVFNYKTYSKVLKDFILDKRL